MKEGSMPAGMMTEWTIAELIDRTLSSQICFDTMGQLEKPLIYQYLSLFTLIFA
jgi:hypothetical protein